MFKIKNGHKLKEYVKTKSVQLGSATKRYAQKKYGEYQTERRERKVREKEYKGIRQKAYEEELGRQKAMNWGESRRRVREPSRSVHSSRPSRSQPSGFLGMGGYNPIGSLDVFGGRRRSRGSQFNPIGSIGDLGFKSPRRRRKKRRYANELGF